MLAVVAALVGLSALAWPTAGRLARAGATTADAAPSSAKIPLTEFFKGRVVAADKDGNVTLRYDFEDAAQLADFGEALPFKAVSTIKVEHKNGRIRLRGTGGWRHRAVFDGTVEAKATFIPHRPYDFGFAVTESRRGEIFTLYCVRDRYFSKGDGVLTPQNMIIKFIPRVGGQKTTGVQDWRYCGSRGPKPAIRTAQSIDVSIRREGLESVMEIRDTGESDTTFKAKGKEADRDLADQMVAVYGYETDVRFDDLVVSGRLSAAFVEQHSLDLDVEIQAPEEEGPPAADGYGEEATTLLRERIAAYPLHTKPADVVKLLRDASIPVELRREVAARAVSVGKKNLVPLLIDALYDEEESTRGLAIEVVDGLAGRTFGFKAGGSEARRKKAIKALTEYVQKNARQFR